MVSGQRSREEHDRDVAKSRVTEAYMAVSKTVKKTETSDHGRKAKTDTTTVNSTTDANGNVARDTTTSSTKVKKHHGKVKATTTTDSNSSVEHPR